MSITELPAGIDINALRALAGVKLSQPPTTADRDGLLPAISYLRVSTKDQATRNGLDEGLSIPAQRDAAARKARQLGAVIVEEFIEPGESAKTAQRRALQRMLDYIANNPVRYCIINKVDRLARNRLDDAMIHATLRDAGVTLVSVTENIDETPSGMLMHGIMASIAEFYSLNLGQEVTKGMVQKATIGGTPTKAPAGYLNIRTTDASGHEVRTIQLDPERADLIRYAFAAYADGDWSLSKLARELTTRGLTTRPTPSQPAKPMTPKLLHKILTNPYYQGIVTFRGVTYPGTHEPLTDPETFDRVQTVLAANKATGDRPQKYDHYLKGTLFCSCGAKLMYERPRNRHGTSYEYFTCAGRRLKRNACQRAALLVDRVEECIEHAYTAISLTSAQVGQVREVLYAVFRHLEVSSNDERATLSTQKNKLEAEQVKLLQAHYADAIPIDLLKTEQDRIRGSLTNLNTRLDNLDSTYDRARTGLDDILDLLHDLAGLYLRSKPAERRTLNRALFTKIIIDDDTRATIIPAGAAATILKATSADPEDDRTLPHIDPGQGSNFDTYVELRGFEPLTFSMPWRRATNCAIAPCGCSRGRPAGRENSEILACRPRGGEIRS